MDEFEKNICSLTGSSFAVGVGSGTDDNTTLAALGVNLGVTNCWDAVALAARILQDQLHPFINFDEPEIPQEQTSQEKLPFNPNLLKKVEKMNRFLGHW